MKNKYLGHILCIVVFLIILVIFTFPIVLQMNDSVYGPLHGTDNRAAIWHFEWFNYASKHHLNLDNNVLTNYPYGIDNMSPSIFPLCLIPAYIFSTMFNEIFAYNILILISFMLSFVFMYILVFYLTKNRTAAFISGIIYSLCPYHINKSWEHFGLTFIEFIPLYIYFLLNLKNKPNVKNVVFCSVSLILVIFSDLTYGFIISVFTFFYFFLTLLFLIKRRSSYREIFSFFINFFKMCTLSASLLLFMFLPKLRDSLPSSAQGENFTRPFKYLFTQSASILSYLIPSKFHPFWGGIGRALEGSIFFGRGSTEQTLYLGIVGIILAFYGLKTAKHTGDDIAEGSELRNEKYTKFLFVSIFIISIIFSMPPYWNLLFFKVYFPSFFIYKVFPVFRAYARFGVLAILSISILAGFGVAKLVAMKNKRTIATLGISLLVLIDFMNFPPMRVTRIDKCPEVYQWLSKQSGNFAIVEYPVRVGDTAEGYINLDYLLYQRCHQKPSAINGAKPGTKAFEIKQKVADIGNYSTPLILKSLGVKYAIVHLKDYEEGSNVENVEVEGQAPDLSKLKSLKFIKRFGDDEVYELI